MTIGNGQGADGIMRLKDTIDRIPGGLMLAPLLLGALCRTFAPDAPNYFKGFTQGIMTGVIPILAVWFFCMGASIKLSATGTVLRKSGTLVVTKFLAAGRSPSSPRGFCRPKAFKPASSPACPFWPSSAPWI